MMNNAPTLATSSAALPPEGAQSALGRPSGGLVAPTLATSSAVLPPEGAQSALGRPSGGFSALARTRIKICGLTREQDVDAAVAAGVDAIGFVLYPRSLRCVTPERARELSRRLPPFVTPVLLVVNQPAQQTIDACTLIPNAVVQFHGDESPEDCLQATRGGARPYLRAARIPLGEAGGGFDLVKYVHEYSNAQAILLDAHVDGYGGAGKVFNWSLLPANVNAHLVLSGGLTAANVLGGILQVRPRCLSLAVDVSSGVEVSGPGNQGLKDPEKINQFVAAVRAADKQLEELVHVTPRELPTT